MRGEAPQSMILLYRQRALRQNYARERGPNLTEPVRSDGRGKICGAFPIFAESVRCPPKPNAHGPGKEHPLVRRRKYRSSQRGRVAVHKKLHEPKEN